MNQIIQQQLTSAVAFNGAMLLQATSIRESLIRAVLDATVKIVDPIARGERLVAGINETCNIAVMREVSQRLDVSGLLKKFIEANGRGEAVEYEFTTDRDNYEGVNAGGQPIDTTKLVGVAGLLVSVLSAVGCELVWAPRDNGLKAKFVIKG